MLFHTMHHFFNVTNHSHIFSKIKKRYILKIWIKKKKKENGVAIRKR